MANGVGNIAVEEKGAATVALAPILSDAGDASPGTGDSSPCTGDATPIASGPHLTVGFVGHPNVGKTSLLNAIVGRKVASVSRTPGHTKHMQTWQLTPVVTICDSPGLVFPMAGALVADVGVGARAVYEACGLFPIAQVRECYSAVRLLHASQDLIKAYSLQHSPELRDVAEEELSPVHFCMALAERKGYRIARGRGALDLHRAGLEILKDCVDGAICLAFEPPAPDASDERDGASKLAAHNNALHEVLDHLSVWAEQQWALEHAPLEQVAMG